MRLYANQARALPRNICAPLSCHRPYKSGKDAKGQIKTIIQPLDEKTAASVTALEALSWCEFRSDLVVPLVTSVAQSRYVDEVEEPSK